MQHLKTSVYGNEWNEFNKRMLVVSNDSKRKEIRSQAIELDTKIFNRLKELKEELMMNKVDF